MLRVLPGCTAYTRHVSVVRAALWARSAAVEASMVCRSLRLSCCEFVLCLEVVMEIAQTCGAAMLHYFKSKRVRLRNARLVRSGQRGLYASYSRVYFTSIRLFLLSCPTGPFKVLDHKMRYKIWIIAFFLLRLHLCVFAWRAAEFWEGRCCLWRLIVSVGLSVLQALEIDWKHLFSCHFLLIKPNTSEI